MIVFWRRVDVPGLECARIVADGDTVRALSTILCEEAGGFRCDYDWQMNSDWSTRRLTVTREGTNGRQSRVMERSDGAWIVDGAHRPDLDGAEEPDLSVTPFCNTIPIRRLSTAIGSSITLDTVYIEGRTLSVERSRQRYIRLAPNVVRYVDLGAHDGFEAELFLDEKQFVRRYEGLFERVSTSS